MSNYGQKKVSSRAATQPTIKGDRRCRFRYTECKTQRDAPKIDGHVFAGDCKTPVAHAILDIWHCDNQGNYDLKDFARNAEESRVISLQNVKDQKIGVFDIYL